MPGRLRQRNKEVFRKTIVKHVQARRIITEWMLTMIDIVHGIRVGDVHGAVFSDEFIML